MIMGSLMELEEKMLLNCALYPQMNQGEIKKARRRRKKAKAEDGSAEGKKRKLSEEQVTFLEMNFGQERKLESGRKMSLASELGLDPKQVAVWFQNRRARWKNKQLEEEYMKLKSQHDTMVVEKCHAENEVLSLKKRLAEAEKKINMLSVGGCSEEGGSLSSSSTGNYGQRDLGDQFGSANDLLYINDPYNYISDYGFIFGM